MLHIGIYKARQNINAVLHTHSVYASAIAVAGLDIPPIVEDQVNFIGGEIRLAKYAMSGSDELAENVVAALGERNAALLPNHGAVGIGRTMREALTVCQLLEKTAQIYCLVLAAGKVNVLPAEVVEADKAFFNILQSGPG
jgi:L-fuculose-phosphate aldolase